MAAPSWKAIATNGASGTRSAKPAAPTVQPPAPAPATVQAFVDNERLSFAATILTGYKVEVQVKSGIVYEGIFHTATPGGKGMNVVLKYAKVVLDPSATAADAKALAQKPAKTQIIKSDDLVQLIAHDVRMNPEDLALADDFETDASISRGRGGKVGRELQRWMPEDGEDVDFSLESDSTGWDQFKVNREKFGVETTFDENVYTTKINQSECGISEAEAARLAREIENSSTITSNVHLLEERGQELDDDGMNEEEKYSSVIRTSGAPAQHPRGPASVQQPRSRAAHPGPGGPPPPPRGPAWGNMGAGVAAVRGGIQQRWDHTGQQHAPPPPPPAAGSGAASAAAGQQPPPPPPPPPRAAGAPAAGAAPAASAPVAGPADVDLRREANKVRTALVSSALPIKKSSLTHTGAMDPLRGTAYMSPKHAHLVGAAGAHLSKSPVQGLQSQLVGDPKAMLALDLNPGITPVDDETKREFMRFKSQQAKAHSTTKEEEVNELKNFHAALKGPGSSGGAKPQPAEAAAAGAKAPEGAAAPAAGEAPAAAAAPAATEVSKPAPAAEAPKKSLLNPNAKPFSLNINAKEFVPSFAPPAAAAPAAPAAAPAPPPPPAPAAPAAPAPPAPAPPAGPIAAASLAAAGNHGAPAHGGSFSGPHSHHHGPHSHHQGPGGHGGSGGFARNSHGSSHAHGEGMRHDSMSHRNMGGGDHGHGHPQAHQEPRQGHGKGAPHPQEPHPQGGMQPMMPPGMQHMPPPPIAPPQGHMAMPGQPFPGPLMPMPPGAVPFIQPVPMLPAGPVPGMAMMARPMLQPGMVMQAAPGAPMMVPMQQYAAYVATPMQQVGGPGPRGPGPAGFYPGPGGPPAGAYPGMVPMGGPAPQPHMAGGPPPHGGPMQPHAHGHGQPQGRVMGHGGPRGGMGGRGGKGHGPAVPPHGAEGAPKGE